MFWRTIFVIAPETTNTWVRIGSIRWCSAETNVSSRPCSSESTVRKPVITLGSMSSGSMRPSGGGAMPRMKKKRKTNSRPHQ